MCDRDRPEDRNHGSNPDDTSHDHSAEERYDFEPTPAAEPDPVGD